MSKVTCPCCGTEVDAPDIKVDMNSNVLMVGEKLFRVSPQMAELMNSLIPRWPQMVRYQTILQEMHGVNEPEHAEKSMMVIAYSCRKLLRPLGWNIVATHGVGYRLVRLDADANVVTLKARRLAA